LVDERNKTITAAVQNRGISPLGGRKITMREVFALTWCDDDGDGVCVAASTAGAGVAVREQ